MCNQLRLMFRKIVYLLVFFFAFVLPGQSLANSGIFNGASNVIIPIKNTKIKLTDANINIRMSIEEDNGEHGVPFIPWVNVKAVFVLENPSDENVDLHVGFPFYGLQGFGDEEKALSSLDFKVDSNNIPMKISLKEGVLKKQVDPNKLYNKVLTWVEHFDPYEKKDIVVNYKMLMTVSATNTIDRKIQARINGIDYSDIDDMVPGIQYDFYQITNTAANWNGSLEEIKFILDAKEFLNYINVNHVLANNNFRPVTLETMYPSGYNKEANGIYKWNLRKNQFDNDIKVSFTTLIIPAYPYALKSFLNEVSYSTDSEDYKVFKAVLNAYYQIIANGEIPTDPALVAYFKEVHYMQDIIINGARFAHYDDYELVKESAKAIKIEVGDYGYNPFSRDISD
jgi:hypothetical protein